MCVCVCVWSHFVILLHFVIIILKFVRHYPFVALCHNIFQKDPKRVGLSITRCNKTCYYKESRSRLLGMFYHNFDKI